MSLDHGAMPILRDGDARRRCPLFGSTLEDVHEAVHQEKIPTRHGRGYGKETGGWSGRRVVEEVVRGVAGRWRCGRGRVEMEAARWVAGSPARWETGEGCGEGVLRGAAPGRRGGVVRGEVRVC